MMILMLGIASIMCLTLAMSGIVILAGCWLGVLSDRMVQRKQAGK